MPTRTRWPFSNFETIPGGLAFEGLTYPTLEHAFQAAKTLDPGERVRVARCSTPGAAKRLGRHVTLRDDWDERRLAIMAELLALKWGPEPFRSQLLATGADFLIEWNTWHDIYWGLCSCARHHGTGRNHLGRLLMELRDQLRRVEGV
jgi:ribA/ribD-fused uncharacterized protein